ncbi:MAG: polysaccharide pyruvyl transferase family protein [Cyanobacteria bacterium P01_H01_bin.21]
MKILIEFGGYSLANLGDFAMLQVAVSRLKKRWPDCQITVFTTNPERLKELCPAVDPLDITGQFKFDWASFFSKKIRHYATRLNFSDALHNVEWKIHQIVPGLAKKRIETKIAQASANDALLTSQLKAIQEADLVISSGGGYITDTFPNKAERTLSILNLSVCLGKPTVLLGHGIGPLVNKQLRAKASIVLPKMSFISLRESRRSVSLLHDLGVSDSQITTTGDDAIELAYQTRSADYGDGIGVNLRAAKYSNVATDSINRVRTAIHSVAKEKNIPLYPVPICHHPDENDPKAIQAVLAGYDDTSDGGQSLKTPVEIAQQAGRCRVVITGSYHAGVFSLSQGIPIIGLAKSAYYQDKFLGLADQFGAGCQVVFLNDDSLENNLKAAIETAWDSLEITSPQLLDSAKRQIDRGHAAYQQVYRLMEKNAAA